MFLQGVRYTDYTKWDKKDRTEFFENAKKLRTQIRWNFKYRWENKPLYYPMRAQLENMIAIMASWNTEERLSDYFTRDDRDEIDVGTLGR